MLEPTTIPEMTGTAESIGTLGIGGFLLWQIARLSARVQVWLDALSKHHERIERHHERVVDKLGELVIAARHAGGVPEQSLRDPTPIRGIDSRG